MAGSPSGRKGRNKSLKGQAMGAARRAGKKYLTTNTGRLRSKLTAQRAVKRGVARVRSKGIGLLSRATGGSVYKFTAKRKAALAKARRASAQARKGKNRATNAVSSAIARARTAMGRTSRRGTGRTGGGIR